METKHENKMAEQKIGKLLFSMAVPAIIAQIINVLYNVVDRIYIGHIPVVGAEALTGVGVTMPLIMVISAFAALISMGGAPRASINLGMKNKAAAEKILGNCTTALVVMAVLLTVAVLVYAEKMLMLFGASQQTIGYALDYMRIYALGTIFVQLALGLNAFITAQGFAKTSMMTVTIGAVANIILDPILMFGFDMGVKGAAWATIISQAISAVWVIIFLMGKTSHIKIKRENLKVDFKVLLPCLALGLSPFMMQATESILAIAFNASLQRYGGDLAVGAMTILASVMQFSILPIMGLTQGAQPIISYNFGANQPDRVKQTFSLLLKSTLSYATLLWILVMLFPQLFARLFTADASLIAATVSALRIYMAVSLLLSVQISCQQTFIALGNARISIFLALLRKVFLLIPLIFILPKFMSNQVTAVFLAEPIADTLAVLVTTILFVIEFSKTLTDRALDAKVGEV